MVFHYGTFIPINCRVGMEYFVFTWSIFNALFQSATISLRHTKILILHLLTVSYTSLIITTPSRINTFRNNSSKNTGVDKQNIRKLRSLRTSIRGHLPKLVPNYIYSLMLKLQVAISFQNAYVKASSVYAGKNLVTKNTECFVVWIILGRSKRGF